MTSTDSKTVIGPHTKISGEISGTENLTVDGKVEGVIRLEGGCLTIRPDGQVRATVIAQDVIVLGRLEGEIRASGLLQLRGSAVVQGDVFAARLSIEDGASLRGNLDPSRSSEPLSVSGGSFDVLPSIVRP
ncbi:bactofilin family protein [Granulicella paludicola]|uniref:bactofilin family protein n=1 Tax=Granulicella paludicola TaxID=474951 RepID=UPI0021DF72C9|nr:polymer-forming cytoskeletal protein [Granulicella paludicola]